MKQADKAVRKLKKALGPNVIVELQPGESILDRHMITTASPLLLPTPTYKPSGFMP